MVMWRHRTVALNLIYIVYAFALEILKIITIYTLRVNEYDGSTFNFENHNLRNIAMNQIMNETNVVTVGPVFTCKPSQGNGKGKLTVSVHSNGYIGIGSTGFDILLPNEDARSLQRMLRDALDSVDAYRSSTESLINLGCWPTHIK
jgi:hypothetical protein